MAGATKKSGHDQWARPSAALFLLIIAAAAILAIGASNLGNPLGEKSAGFLKVKVSDWKLSDEGSLAVTLENEAEEDVNVTMVNVSLGARTAVYRDPVVIASGGRRQIIVDCPFAAMVPEGKNRPIDVKILYEDVENGFHYLEEGTLISR